jgi:hypothetical protein
MASRNSFTCCELNSIKGIKLYIGLWIYDKYFNKIVFIKLYKLFFSSNFLAINLLFAMNNSEK